MYRYFKKLATESFPSTSTPGNSPLNQETGEHNTQTQTSNFNANTNPSPCGRSGVDSSAFQSDPAERKSISHYHPNEYDEVRRAYIPKALVNLEICFSSKIDVWKL